MKKYYYIILPLLLALASCKKFLEEKSDSSIALAETLADQQSLLDHYQVLNQADGNAAEISSTDFYLTDTDFLSRLENERNMYTWQRTNIFLPEINEWGNNYRAVYRANSVIENLGKIQRNTANTSQWDNVSGQAHYYRAKNILKTLFVWAPAYDAASAAQDLGVPLRTGSDFNVPSVRASVEEGYSQVISDLKVSIRQLPPVAVHVMRPSRAAAFGLLARTLVTMRRYSEAYLYADSSLQLKSSLMDFNTLNAAATLPIPQFNVEVLHDSYFTGVPLSNVRAKTDPQLFTQYELNDLRRTVFFNDNKNGTYGFKGSYEGFTTFFAGVAVDEVLLIRAECLARLNRLPEALADLNKLLRNRYKRNTFIDRNSSNQDAVIDMVLNERRKELLMRGLRWADVKRLNKEGAGISLTRTVNGKTYVLVPNSSGFVLPIPESVIEISGMQQNP
ncbi:RagB/SusD family nutrient uptake outer membrane protein [Pedobacter petrophilus]|uniref:RagB/SusD family nutrient uptake outer membrane protein n=1 Tax=Pedobacter petrophilus TaxID=1908241 RepID=A0A7K0FXD3_9SPHI|nr:RagB/SusD family nutrient uptake outer membrane protein [Pedobacter petrophilus]MRX75714.1 RagB/SusD family nutrient uptake outer membrane protein [Pedobacter petrophilus]